MNTRLSDQRHTSAFYSDNASFIEALYSRYLQDAASVAPYWRDQFAALDQTADADIIHQLLHEQLKQPRSNAIQPPRNTALPPHARAPLSNPIAIEKQAAVLRLINAYRCCGHQIANLDPIQLYPKPDVADLDPGYHQLSSADFNRVFHTGSLYAPDFVALRDILALLKKVYCGSVGSEYMHITTMPEKRWIQKRLESYQTRPVLEPDDQRWLLTLLTAAEELELHLHTRYVGQKRFSLEGGEALIPLLDELIQRAGRKGIQEIVIGMAHRGRLNVLINTLGKPPQDIFAAFEDQQPHSSHQFAGDVKYHLGFATDIATPGGAVHVALGFNPSHLEIINPVIEGAVRARQRRRGNINGDQVLPVLIHGDAAFSGQGIVMETLQLSQTRGYSTGGTVHIIINNQIGFTTSHPLDTRSTLYCTDVAKMVQTPIFHVNADDPEAVIFVTRLAFDFRHTFKRDVLIDLVCYRRLGHNEADEPAVTQPIMYQKIHQHPTARTLYANYLINHSIITASSAQTLIKNYRTAIAQGVVVARPVLCTLNPVQRANWQPFIGNHWTAPAVTHYPRSQLTALADRLLTVPSDFVLHSRVNKIWAERRQMAQGELPINWGFAETLAYATLITAGHPVRLSGQDSGRGTFFHRHAKIYCQKTGRDYTPLQHLSHEQAAFVAIDSILSEAAVLGFEYGFATATPEGLTLWEAQFGDFANGAQVVIDQFIASAETKWELLCGLVLLLPHGLEGQGAEHSSARLERYLQLCAEHNLQLCIPTTPAQFFHLLRRQIIRPYRHPLIVFTPKSLLRHRLAVSTLDELATGQFQVILPDAAPFNPTQLQRVIFCTGKVYYDLIEARQQCGIETIAIVRLEQLYPFPRDAFLQLLKTYAQVNDIVWCQEEAQNQGAWDLIKHRFHAVLPAGKTIRYIGRPMSAAPAVGKHSIHIAQQQRLIDEAMRV
ncbi:2-oxoglutarate dehydrogenase E1 component [Rhodoferax sp. 4810]|uniref:2-oxoglutarate dehydrogenase E1 component n=1 Tax=Thiospirillum jenense TaxID=1653858 RepID=A0A839HEP3_9GAMM|nr:2-oxoglutarate dehydrogenase E1 component [Thiospirillum jenense]MBB1073366.1 2-oxoglutarate dehydrogenase E1 component [Rhodoferax jenense]MBB1125718.1 2-oxoglutarate dehydrogenase E1 component [Thiospirillum jenense]